ncbi:hypothetical protein, partial [Kumtagia ephedrae]|uniref:hypothetical protein n=1 Tax=Kumtagia ephedrae TaxID=2116701 RepID=UPI001A9C5B44
PFFDNCIMKKEKRGRQSLLSAYPFGDMGSNETLAVHVSYENKSTRMRKHPGVNVLVDSSVT